MFRVRHGHCGSSLTWLFRCIFSTPMWRQIFTVISLLSLLACIATVIFWVRSYCVGDKPRYRWSYWYGTTEAPVYADGYLRVWSRSGDILVSWDRWLSWGTDSGPG